MYRIPKSCAWDSGEAWNPKGFKEFTKWVLKNIRPVEGRKRLRLLQTSEVFFTPFSLFGDLQYIST